MIPVISFNCACLYSGKWDKDVFTVDGFIQAKLLTSTGISKKIWCLFHPGLSYLERSLLSIKLLLLKIPLLVLLIPDEGP